MSGNRAFIGTLRAGWRGLLLAALGACASAARGQALLDEVSVNGDTVTLTFSCPVGLLSAFSSDGNLQTRLRLSPGPQCAAALAAEAGGRRWTDFATPQDVLDAVETQVDGIGATFAVLRFVAPRVTRARQGRGADRIDVVLAPDDGAAREMLPAAAGRVERAATETVATATSDELPSRAAALMEEARQAFVAGDLDRAVALYTAVSSMPPHAQSADALEFLGVTRQRKGQLAHAKAVFERYLETYPSGEGRGRVQQRLAAIAAPPTVPGRRAAAARTKGPGHWQTYGAHSSYLRRNTVSVDDIADVTNLSMWQGDVDLVARRRGLDVDVMSRLTAGYRADFTDFDRDRGGVLVTNAWLEVTDRAHALHGRFGRQSRSAGGVYGRFDGAHVAWDWRAGVRLNAVAGFPVRRSSSRFDSERSMFGASVDFEGLADDWDVTLFANNHIVDGIADRRGVGGEFRYFDTGRNVYGVLDYDTLYSSVNAALLSASLTGESRINVHGTLDYRRSPLLSTSNAIIGQGVTSIDELSDVLREDELQQLAADNTATSTTASIGVSLPLGARFQWSTDLQASELQTAVNFASLDGANASNTTLSLNSQLVATSWWRASDAWIVGLRLADSDTFRIASVTLNTRLPFGDHLRLNPLLRVVYRDNRIADGNEWIVTPGLRASLRWQRRFVIEAEVRGDLSRRASVIGTVDRSSLYYSVGYRADFGR